MDFVERMRRNIRLRTRRIFKMPAARGHPRALRSLENCMEKRSCWRLPGRVRRRRGSICSIRNSRFRRSGLFFLLGARALELHCARAQGFGNIFVAGEAFEVLGV